MDFNISMKDGLAQMSFDKSKTIFNNIFLSLMVRRGAFFYDPDFGSRLHLLLRAKNTEQTAALAEEYCTEALRWIIETGRATKIDITAERVGTDRLHLLVEVTQADGRKITFNTFIEVA